MKRIQIFFFLIFGFNFLFSQNNIQFLLENSYKSKNLDSLNLFFDKWEQESLFLLNNMETNSLSDTLNDICQIYQAFINSFEKEILDNKSEYFIIQNQIKWEFEDLNYDSKTKQYFYYKDSIVNFTPNLLIKNHKVLFSIPTFTNSIISFLGYQYSADNIMAPCQPVSDSKIRNEWLSDKVIINLSHWGDYWIIESNPHVINIELKNSRDSAVIYFSYMYSRGTAILKKVNNEWILISKNFNAIE